MRRPAVVLLTTALLLASGGPVSAEVAADELPTRAIVRDPAGDAVGDGRLAVKRADVVRTSYRTPKATGGTITVRVTWAQLRRKGPFQRVHVFVDQRTDGKDEPSGFEGARAGVAVHTYTQGESFAERVRPEVLTVRRQYGAGGTTTITMSTEWLDADEVDVYVFAEAGRGFATAWDGTDVGTLRVGPAAD